MQRFVKDRPKCKGIKNLFFLIMIGGISSQPEDLFGSSAFLRFKAC